MSAITSMSSVRCHSTKHHWPRVPETELRLGFLCVLVLTIATLSMASKQQDVHSFFPSQNQSSDVSGNSVDDSLSHP